MKIINEFKFSIRTEIFSTHSPCACSFYIHFMLTEKTKDILEFHKLSATTRVTR